MFISLMVHRGVVPATVVLTNEQEKKLFRLLHITRVKRKRQFSIAVISESKGTYMNVAPRSTINTNGGTEN